MQSLGNDFILIENEILQGFSLTQDIIRSLCHRNYGIGSDGLILYHFENQKHFRMKFFNPDGLSAKMCANGLRCLFRYTNAEEILTDRGLYKAKIKDNTVSMMMPNPQNLKDVVLEISNEKFFGQMIDSGVEHVVLKRKELSKEKLRHLASSIRHHSDFFPHGVNVNFVDENDSPTILTYERGVEDFTRACGTGALACFSTMNLKKAKMLFFDGEEVEFLQLKDGIEMKAEAYKVYEGVIELPIPFDS